MIAIDDVIGHIHDLPSLPAVVTELLASMERDEVDLHFLAAKITHDQALTAKTLRLANSSFYGMQSRVTSIPQAMAVLGFRSIRTLVTACALTGNFAPAPGARFDFPAFWRHAVGTAVAARALAPRMRLPADTAFIAGLLHDIGILVLATRYPDPYQQVLAWRARHECGTVEAERAVFGLDHTVVGGLLASHWKFPAAIIGAVASHHELAEHDLLGLPLTIHIANTIAHGLDLSGQEDDLAPPVTQRVWRALALSDDAWLDVFRETERGFHEMCQVLMS